MTRSRDQGLETNDQRPMKILNQFLHLFRRTKLDVEMSEEMRLHIELQTERNVEVGTNAEEARYTALKQFGNVAGIQEQARDARGWVWLEQFGKDLRYAARSLGRSPSFTITAVLTLALGIGVNAALFSAYNSIALRALPVKDPESLVRIIGQSRKLGNFPNYSWPEYLDYRDSNRVLSGLAAVWLSIVSVDDNSGGADPLIDVRGAGTAVVQNVSSNYFEVLGANWTLGRGFLPEENRAPGDGAVIVLSHFFWTRRMQGDPAVLGQTIKLRGKPYTVIGVTAEDFTGDQPAPPLGWVPIMDILRNQNLTTRSFTPIRLLGRLRAGVTEEQAKADLDQIAARLAKFNPDEGGRDSVTLERGMRFLTMPKNPKMLAAIAPILFGFGMVLLIACLNVTNLLLARSITRQQEIGVRLTLGASRGRMLRQLLTENLLICVLGAVAGLGFATWTLELLKPVLLGYLPPDWAFEARRWFFLDFMPDHRMAVFTAVMALVAAVGAGFLPALQASRTDLVSSLKNNGTALGLKLGQVRLRNGLVVVQVAISLMLLSCAGLLVRNMIELRNPKLGFDPGPVFQVNVNWKTPWPSDPLARDLLLRQATDQLRVLPGVASAALAQWGPLLGGPETRMTVSHRAGGQPDAKVGRFCFMTDGFIDTFGLQLLRGRSFTAEEVMADQRFLVVSESAAAKFWPGEDPIGQFLSLREELFANAAKPTRDSLRQFQVIGVVGDVSSNLMDQKHVFVYAPRAPGVVQNGALWVRPRGDTAAMLAAIVKQADAAGIRLQAERRLSANIIEQRLPFVGLSALSGLLAGLALLMASVGLYGVMAFSVNQRTKEIGIRAALGATAENIIGLFIRQGFRLIAVGVIVGLGAGIGFSLLLPKVLFGGSGAFDPLTFGIVTLIFTVVALLACWLPARRAAKMDPMVALRAE
jgi:macrolide transport system ATP-binding/permease protein